MITFGHVTFRHTCAGSASWEEIYQRSWARCHMVEQRWLQYIVPHPEPFMTLSMCVQIAGQHDSTAGSPFHHGWSVPMFVVLSLHSAVIQLEFLLCTPVVRSLTISCANVTVVDPIEPSDVRIILYFFLFYSPPGSFFLSWTSFPLLKLPSPFPFLLPFFPLHFHVPFPSLSPLPLPSPPLPPLPLPLHALQASAYSYHECSCIRAITWNNCWRSRETLWCESPWSF